MRMKDGVNEGHPIEAVDFQKNHKANNAGMTTTDHQWNARPEAIAVVRKATDSSPQRRRIALL